MNLANKSQIHFSLSKVNPQNPNFNLEYLQSNQNVSLRTSWIKISVKKCILRSPYFEISVMTLGGILRDILCVFEVIRGMGMSGKPMVSLRTPLHTKQFLKVC